MIKLTMPSGPWRLTLPNGVVFAMAEPVDAETLQAAQQRVRRLQAAETHLNEDRRAARSVLHLATGIALYAGEGWEGVAGEDDAPAPFDEAHVGRFFRQSIGAADAFVAQVLAPLDLLAAEGNG